MSSSSLRRMPVEWARHDATWLTWPHSEPTWPGCMDEARLAFTEMIRVIGRGERVELLVQNEVVQQSAETLLKSKNVDLAPVRFHLIETNDSWFRDYGAIYVHDGNDVVAVNWRFNSWGGKYPWELDDRAGKIASELSGCRRETIDVVMEGGSIDIDEDGCLLTTHHNVYTTTRGDRRGDEFFDTLKGPLGLTDVIMLGEGIVGDDTDGHVDDITRFTPGKSIVTVVEPDRGDPNHEPLAENLETLKREVQRTGHRLVELPMPEPVEYEGERLPASYANFYVTNAAVLVPVFEQKRDAEALRIIDGLFPDRPVAPIDARYLVVGLGSCHCLTNNQPTALR